MGFRFSKRINLGGGLGLNVSKSGISPSLRTKGGTISNKGFSLKTGVSGVNYRNNFAKAKSSGCVLLFVYTGIAISLVYIFKHT